MVVDIVNEDIILFLLVNGFSHFANEGDAADDLGLGMANLYLLSVDLDVSTISLVDGHLHFSLEPSPSTSLHLHLEGFRAYFVFLFC
jgi:hypothetical protein